MNPIFYIHFNEKELKEKIKPLKEAGYNINYHFSTGSVADIRKYEPEVLIICLDRLPSHGRRYAEWFWEAKKRQHIPIVFCGGSPEKVLITKEKFPATVFCSNEKLLSALSGIS